MENAIASACRLKARIVEEDERESGRRRILNFGHTLGHALEAATGYRRFTHGEAVGWGMLGATLIARRRGLLAEEAFDRIVGAVDRLGPRPPIGHLEPEAIAMAVTRDKNKQGGRVPFILPTAIGGVTIASDIRETELLGTIRALREWVRRAAGEASAAPSGREGGSRPHRRRSTAARR
jgi:3-dehydroquinate synthase